MSDNKVINLHQCRPPKVHVVISSPAELLCESQLYPEYHNVFNIAGTLFITPQKIIFLKEGVGKLYKEILFSELIYDEIFIEDKVLYIGNSRFQYYLKLNAHITQMESL